MELKNKDQSQKPRITRRLKNSYETKQRVGRKTSTMRPNLQITIGIIRFEKNSCIKKSSFVESKVNGKKIKLRCF